MKVLLCVSGGIAAYKSANLVRAFIKRGDEVRVVMTSSAQEFITPMTLQVLSGHPVGRTLFDLTFESEIGHIELARWPDVVLVAPATANVIARAAHGLADDLLTTILLATTAPVVVAPAMNTQMYVHPSVARNLRILQDFGYQIVEPDSGELACKEVGAGRLPDAPVLVSAAIRATTPQLLAGRKVVITAGPTREHMDPARFISNPSSGRMGYALAEAAWQHGADVTLISGPCSLDVPHGVRVVDVMSARQMYDAVWAEAPSADVVVKVAAVADWRPATPSERKRTKSEMDGTLTMERTDDILRSLGAKFGPGSQERGPLIVGFAAESHDVEARGAAKLARKNAHMLVANQIGGTDSAFGAQTSSVSVLYHPQYQRDALRLPLADKSVLARTITQEYANMEQNHE